MIVVKKRFYTDWEGKKKELVEFTEDMFIPKSIGKLQAGFNTAIRHLKALPAGHRCRNYVFI